MQAPILRFPLSPSVAVATVASEWRPEPGCATWTNARTNLASPDYGRASRPHFCLPRGFDWAPIEGLDLSRFPLPMKLESRGFGPALPCVRCTMSLVDRDDPLIPREVFLERTMGLAEAPTSRRWPRRESTRASSSSTLRPVVRP
jgi:hypothetical protein